MSEPAFEVVDRYSATGTPYPNPETVCEGQCEGMGCVPIGRGETDPLFAALWQEEHEKAHRFAFRLKMAWKCSFLSPRRRIAILWEKCDGWHFVKCPECKGTGKRS